MNRYPRWPIHLALLAVSFVMLVPFYWVLKTSVSGENIFAYPPSLISEPFDVGDQSGIVLARPPQPKNMGSQSKKGDEHRNGGGRRGGLRGRADSAGCRSRCPRVLLRDDALDVARTNSERARDPVDAHAFGPKNPHLFYYVDVWYYIPFARYFLNSVIVSALCVGANVVFNAMAGYALTRGFAGKGFVLMLFLSCMMVPFQATIIPAYLITGRLGLLDSYLGLALPQMSTIVCIFVFKASFDAVPRSLIDAAKIDGLPEWRIVWRVMMPLAKAAIATNVILGFIWSWNNFLWPLIVTRSADMQTLPLGLARFLSYQEDTTGALYAFVIMVLAPGILLFLLAQKEFIRGLTSGATKG